LAKSYSEAIRAVAAARSSETAGRVVRFEDLGVLRLLSMIPPEDLDPFVRETLGELHKTTADAKDQRHTLEVLLDVNMNVAEASRILHFHYNTLRYRIAKL